MNTNLISTEAGGNIEEMDFDLKANPSIFKRNKCPIDLKSNKEYTKLDCSIGSQKKGFESCYKTDVNHTNALFILLCLFYSFIFYMLLLFYFIDEDKQYNLLLYLIAIYITGALFQMLVVPKPYFYKTKEELDKIMEPLLNLGVKIHLTNYKRTYKAQYTGCYTTDITGILNIPKKINYLKINGILIYVDKGFSNFNKDFSKVYRVGKSTKLLSLYSGDQEFTFPKNEIFMLNSISGAFSINCLTRIACLFLLQWLNAIIDMSIEKKSCVDVFIVKLVSAEQKQIAPTKITVHGTTYKHNDFTYMAINDEEIETFNKDLEAYKKKLEEEAKQKRIEKERREKRRKEKAENTEELSEFTSNNYRMRIYRYYSTVYLDLFCHEDKKNSYKNKNFELGKFDESVEENIIDEDDQITYTPYGCDIEIVVKNSANSYTIKIGTKFTKNFSYNYE